MPSAWANRPNPQFLDYPAYRLDGFARVRRRINSHQKALRALPGLGPRSQLRLTVMTSATSARDCRRRTECSLEESGQFPEPSRFMCVGKGFGEQFDAVHAVAELVENRISDCYGDRGEREMLGWLG